MLTLLALALAADDLDRIAGPHSTFVARWSTEEAPQPALAQLQSMSEFHAAFRVARGEVLGAWGGFVLDDAVLYELARALADEAELADAVPEGSCGDGCTFYIQGGDRLLVQETDAGVELLSLVGSGRPSDELMLSLVPPPEPLPRTPALQALMSERSSAGLFLRLSRLREWAVLSGSALKERAVSLASRRHRDLLWLSGGAAVTAGLPLLGLQHSEVEDVTLREVDGALQVVGTLSVEGIRLRRRDRPTRLPMWTGDEPDVELAWVSDLLFRASKVEGLGLTVDELGERIRTCGPPCAWAVMARPSTLVATVLRGVGLQGRGLRGVRLVADGGSWSAALVFRDRLLARSVAQRIQDREGGLLVERRGRVVLLSAGGRLDFGEGLRTEPGLELRVQELSTLPAPLSLMGDGLVARTRIERGAVVMDLGEQDLVDWKGTPARSMNGDPALRVCLRDLDTYDLSGVAAVAPPEEAAQYLAATAELLPPRADECAALFPEDLSLRVLQAYAHGVRGLMFAARWDPAGRAHLEIACAGAQVLACDLLSDSVATHGPLVQIQGVGEPGSVAELWAAVEEGQIHFPELSCGLEDRLCIQGALTADGDRHWLGLYLSPELQPSSLYLLGQVTREQGWEWVQAVQGPQPWSALHLYPLEGAKRDRHALVQVTDQGWTAVTHRPLPPLVTKDPAKLAAWVRALSAIDGYAEVAIDGQSWGEVASTASILRNSSVPELYLGMVVGSAKP